MSSAPVDRGRATRSTRVRPTDDQLLDGALEVFAAHGYSATTMSAIAERCGSTKPTLYAHFGSKDELFARLLDRETEACRSMLAARYEANASLELADQVAGDTRALFDYAAQHPSSFRLLLGADLTVAVVRAQQRLRHEVEAHIAHRVQEFLRPGTVEEPPFVLRQLSAVVAGVAIDAAQHALTHDSSMERACELATAFLVAALSGLDQQWRTRDDLVAGSSADSADR